MMPASKAAGHQRGISRCLIRLTARICVIDRSDTAALPGSLPDAAVAPAADDVAADHQQPGSAAGSPLHRAPRRGAAAAPAADDGAADPQQRGSAAGPRLDRALWRVGEVLRRHWLLALLI